MRLALLSLLPMLALGGQRVDVATSESMDFAPGGIVRIEGSTGELNVEGWDQPTVEIQMVRSAWSEHTDKTKADLSRIQVTKQLSGHELTITTAHKRFTGAQVDYRIRVPRNTSVVIHHGIGDVTLYDVSGDIDATARDGDLVVQLTEPAKYEIDAHSKFGTVYSDFANSHHPHLALGETLKMAPESAGGVLHHIRLKVGVGGITIQKIDGHPLLSLN